MQKYSYLLHWIRDGQKPQLGKYCKSFILYNQYTKLVHWRKQWK